MVCQLYGSEVIPVFKDIWKVLLEQALTQDTQSPKYNPFFHQSLLGILLRVYSLHSSTIVELLNNRMESFLSNVQQQVNYLFFVI